MLMTRASLQSAAFLCQTLCKKMRVLLSWLVGAFLGVVLTKAAVAQDRALKTCTLRPLGHGKDDTDQVSIKPSSLSSYII